MKPRQFVPRLLGLLLLAALPLSVPAAPGINPGMWEMTITVNMQDMPMQPPPTVHSRCITADEPVPVTEQPNQECEHVSVDINDNTVNWEIRCTQAGSTTHGSGSATYTDDRMSGTGRVVVKGSSVGDMVMTQALQGHRVGDCSK